MTGPIFLEMGNYTSPEVIETPGKKWVGYGDDNNYFGYLLDRYRGSAVNHAIINGVAESIVGNGLTSAMATKSVDSYAKAKLLFSDGDLKRWAFDLKCYGFYIQQILRDEEGSIESVEYTPVYNWRSGIADTDGNISQMFYSDDWKQINKKKFIPVSVPVYIPDINVELSVYVVKPFRSGSFYYPTVDYQGALQWAHIEEEISNFHLNNIMNGLSPSLLVNFNNGDPGQEQREEIERTIKNKWGGSSNAGRWILSFSDGKEQAATIETVQVSDIDKQYQFLSEESTKKIMVGHRITSPLFFGIRDSSGLGSNSDELKSAWELFENTVLRSYRDLMIEHMELLMDDMDSHIPLEFIPESPINFGLNSDVTGAQLLTDLGEHINMDEWVLVDEGEVDYDLEHEIELNLASTGTARPNAGSKQDQTIDGVNFKVRYQYGGNVPEREFCRKMVSANKLYRKEDIIQMENKAVNPGWGPKGASTYSIWMWKGGGACRHKWVRKTFMSKTGIDTKSPNAPVISTGKGEREGYRVRNDKRVAMKPTDMPNKGFLPGKGK